MSAIEFDLLGTGYRQDLSIDDLMRVDDLCVVFEGKRKDSDGVAFWVFTVGGRLDGEAIGSKDGGCLVGGQAIVVHSRNKVEAATLAYEGVQDTIRAEAQLRLENMRFDTLPNAGIITSVDARH